MTTATLWNTVNMTDRTTSHSNRHRIIRLVLLAVLAIAFIGGGYAYYLFNMPHRDVQRTATDARIDAATLVKEFLDDAAASNSKYFGAEGEGKVLEVTGTIEQVDKHLNDRAVVVLRNGDMQAAIRCTFSESTNAEALELLVGTNVAIKGVIRAGASFDPDLELYEDIVLEQCAMVEPQ
ncbi:MAG: hypothetical protein IPF64_03565 [Flavobacteriales bacterium]|nr:hypothetical protein [Flavobacteriales bacterium]